MFMVSNDCNAQSPSVFSRTEFTQKFIERDEDNDLTW